MHIVTSVRVKSDFAEGSSLTRVLQPVKRLAGVLLVNFAIQTAVAFDVEGSHFLRIATLGGVPSLLVFTSSQEGGSDDFYLQYAPHGSLSKESTATHCNALPSTLFRCLRRSRFSTSSFRSVTRPACALSSNSRRTRALLSGGNGAVASSTRPLQR